MPSKIGKNTLHACQQAMRQAKVDQDPLMRVKNALKGQSGKGIVKAKQQTCRICFKNELPQYVLDYA
jgi:hypothetical protein